MTRELTALGLVLVIGCSDDPTRTANSSTPDASTPSDDGANGDTTDTGSHQPDEGDSSSADLDMGGDGAHWQTRAALPGPQQEVAVVALDGLVYVMGGFSETAAQLATVIVYDPATDTWSSRADFPTRANHMNAVVLDGQIWVTGFLHMGFTPDERVFVYDPGTDAWTPGPDLTTDRGRGSAAIGVVDGRIVLAGGIAPSGTTAMVDVFDPVTGMWTPLPDAMRPFDHAGYGVVDGQLVVAAGRNGAIASYFTDVQIYDPVANEWSAGAPIPTARGGVASAVHDGKLYVFGGEGDPDSPGRVFPQTEAFDLAANSWTTLEPMPIPRHGLAGVALDGVIYLPGGATTEFLDAVATHQIYLP